ncbi:hypothetical protein [Pedobacter puniceum]|uniref:CD-NTase-associated protein 12/Pycsar effector protein TIR domain-containing protein n=1 Tax=Pedobacter puniceum TaxID=2666136 RepID=A0A7K0FIV3_9SPHI|nr:hypothetical protein [Pedobacter puniceum]MRX45914.1 hypothetical protein [Pedobacter puniceum]
MEINLDPQIKPLVANLLRINIGRYLKTSDFNHLTLEHNFDNLWEQGKKAVRDSSNVVFIGFDPSGDYEEAYQLILNALYKQDNKGFFNVLELTLTDFIRWDKGKTDLSKVVENLEQLKMPEDQIQSIKQAFSSKLLTPTIATPDKSPTFEKSEIKIDPKLCFVIMPFNDKLNPIYESIIKVVLKDLKYNPLRADEIFTSKPIIDDIWLNIKKSKFLIADLTDRNPNVFYELGLAHALTKDVILLTQNLSDIPFDLRHYRIIVYQDSISGADKLKSTLKEFITELDTKKKK